MENNNNFDRCMNPPVNDGLADTIRAKADIMAENIRNGKDIEIHSAKGGLKILVIDKKVVR